MRKQNSTFRTGFLSEAGSELLAEQKKLAEYDEKSKELMEQMHSQVDTDKGIDAESEEEATEKITEYLANHSETGSLEYLVRGATLVCRNGSHKRRINLKKMSWRSYWQSSTDTRSGLCTG